MRGAGHAPHVLAPRVGVHTRRAGPRPAIPSPVPPRLPSRELLNRVLSGSAGLVALSALGVSAYQAYLSREQQRMSAWPYVSLDRSNAEGSQFFVRNVGLGPALVRAVEVTVDGRLVRTWNGVVRAAVGRDTGLAYNTVSTSLGPGSVVLPGAAVETFRLAGPPAVPEAVHAAANRDRIVRRVCYCSLYGECWWASSRVREPMPVSSCAADTARAFDDAAGR